MPVIETSHPMPSTSRCGAPRKHVFYDMNVGDSFFVEGETSQGNVAMQSRNYAAKSGKKFVSRKVEGGVRIWRVA